MTTFQDIDFSFDQHPGTHDILKQYDVSAVRSWLKNLLLTNEGELVDNPFYGVGIRSLQFELPSVITKQFLIRRITDQVTRYLPEVRISNIDILFTSENGDVSIQIYFYAYSLPNENKFTYTLERTR